LVTRQRATRIETALAARMATAQSAERMRSIRVLIGQPIMLALPFTQNAASGR
jgi:hypothetical protein